jgi:hypothetical protein
MKRRLRAPWRARAEASDDLGTPWTPAFEAAPRDITRRDTSRWARGRNAVDRDVEIVNALGRVADTFARIADGLDADRRERRGQFEADRDDRRRQLDAVEFLLREMAIGVEAATAVPPVVVGGSIEPDSIQPGTVDLTDQPELSEHTDT